MICILIRRWNMIIPEVWGTLHLISLIVRLMYPYTKDPTIDSSKEVLVNLTQYMISLFISKYIRVSSIKASLCTGNVQLPTISLTMVGHWTLCLMQRVLRGPRRVRFNKKNKKSFIFIVKHNIFMSTFGYLPRISLRLPTNQI